LEAVAGLFMVFSCGDCDWPWFYARP